MLSINVHNLKVSAFSTAGTLALMQTGTVTWNVTNITLSQDGNAITISHNKTDAFGGFGVSNVGQTAGSTGSTQTRVVLAMYGDYSLSQSALSGSDGPANGATISMTGPATTRAISMWPAQPEQMSFDATLYSGSTNGNSTTLSAWMFPMPVNRNLSFNALYIPVSISINTSATSGQGNGSFNAGFTLGLYTKSSNSFFLKWFFSNTLGYSQGTAANSDNMSFKLTMGWDGTSSSISVQGASNSSSVLNSFSGVKLLPFNWSGSPKLLLRNHYYGVFVMSYSTKAGGATDMGKVNSIGMVQRTYVNSSASGVWRQVFLATDKTTAAWPDMGQLSLTLYSNVGVSTYRMATSLAASDISSTGVNLNQSVWVQMMTTGA